MLRGTVNVTKIPTPAEKLLFVVAAALVGDDGRILVQQRPEGRAMAGLWEFPGGKVEPGESPEAALTRELAEELGVTPDGAAIPLAFASEPLGDRRLLLLLYAVHRWRGAPQGHDGQMLRWVKLTELRALAMPPADGPLIDRLADYLAGAATSR